MAVWRLVSCCVVSVSLLGCAVGREDFVLLNPGTQHPSRPADAPVVIAAGELEEPYQELGVIHVSGARRGGYQELNDKLRSEARRAGADAVISVHYGIENAFSLIPFFVAIPYDVLTAEGVAVRKKR